MGFYFRFPNIYPVKVSLFKNDLLFCLTVFEKIFPSGKEEEVSSLAAAFCSLCECLSYPTTQADDLSLFQ